MATKSPTTSVRSREVIGGDQFSMRREVFDKYDTVFLPSPTAIVPTYVEVEPIITSNHGKTTSNFKRNGPTYSSMRETGDRDPIEFRTRKYSDNYTSDLNRSDDYDYRSSMIERNRRLSKLRRDFLASNIHDPSDSPFARTPTRSSMPARSLTKYKIEVPNLYKFPFAEPYLTPPPARKVVVDLGPVDGVEVVATDKENQDPELRPKHQSLPVDQNGKPDHQKLFEQLVKRYSPQRKPIDWTLPPTRPRVVGAVPKSRTASIDNGDEGKVNGDERKVTGDDKTTENTIVNNKISEDTEAKKDNEKKPSHDEKLVNNDVSRDSKNISLTELAETNDRVPELSIIQRQISRESPKKSPTNDKNIPALIEKMNVEAQDLESHKNDNKKIKRKRSFLDKLLGRKKGNKNKSQ